ncbi:MAG: Ig-like domain-containing protein, partial [Treponema sp.]|nr:Ig-like domain-containing protein [Treponema sp.]
MKKVDVVFAALLAALLGSCSLFSSFSDEPSYAGPSSMALDKPSVELSVGSMDMVALTVASKIGQNLESVFWEWDDSVLSVKADNYGAVLTAVREGSTTLRAKCGLLSASCAVNVSAGSSTKKFSNPYVYVSEDFVTVAPGETKKVFASMYGPGDVNGYSFTVDKPSVAGLCFEGNYCWITGGEEGLARVTASHSACSFSCSFLVCCSSDGRLVPYITTSQNIVTLNKTENKSAKFAVEMKNPASKTYSDTFRFSVVDESGAVMADPPVRISALGKEVEAFPLRAGNCFVRVENKDAGAAYHLDVLVRVVEEVDSARIEASERCVTLNGSEPFLLTFGVSDGNGSVAVDNDRWEWSLSSGAEEIFSADVFGGSSSGKGNQAWLSGKKTGYGKITARHPSVEGSKEVLVIVRNMAGEASSSRVYITTSQNYVEAVAGGEPVKLWVNVNGAAAGEENFLSWSVQNQPDSGLAADEVVRFASQTGSATSSWVSASVASAATGNAVVEPVCPGTATIVLSHPKASYQTKIQVRVKAAAQEPKDAPLVLSASGGYVAVKRNEPQTVQVYLSGKSKEAVDENSIEWSCSAPGVSVSGNGATATVAGSSEAPARAELTVSHPKAAWPLSVALFFYDNEDDLRDLKGVFFDQSVVRVPRGGEASVQAAAFGLSESERVSWTLDAGGGEFVSVSASGLSANLAGIKAGTAVLTAKIEGTEMSASVHVSVVEEAVLDEGRPCYLTTAFNVVTLDEAGEADVSVETVNLKPSESSNVKWVNNSPDIFQLSANGARATLAAKKEGTGTVTVSHPLCANEISMTVHVGDEHRYKNQDVAYILSEDTLTLTAGGQDEFFSPVLVHTESSETSLSGFSFRSSDESVLSVSYGSGSAGCSLSARKPGRAVLTVSHPSAAYPKEVLAIVQRSASEMGGAPYVTTGQNVATVEEGEYAALSVSLKNAGDGAEGTWTWRSSDISVADISADTGTTALVKGMGPGTAKITASNSLCQTGLEIILICLDKRAALTAPYVKTSANILTVKKGSSESFTAELAGSGGPLGSFEWTVQNPQVAMVSTSGGTCSVRGLSAGQTFVTVRNPAAAYSKTVLVRVEDKAVENCYITVSSKVLKLAPESSGEKITATLENGEPLDAQDFQWWTDDVSLLSLSAIAGEAMVTPTGLSGAAYVRVKHPKVLEEQKILVLCSKYNDFAFSKDRLELAAGKMAFVPMQVPAIEGETTVEYSSDNDGVCAVAGTKEVCMAAGTGKGRAVITARFKNSSGVIAESQMAVAVERASESGSQINLPGSIITLQQGESAVLSGALSGGDIGASDLNSLEWESSDASIASLLSDADGKVRGRDCRVTAKGFGQAVLTVSHKKCRFPASVWIVVPERMEEEVELDKYYLDLYMGDPSDSVTATILNQSVTKDADITWTAPKVGQSNIISATKKGKVCTVTPRSPGATTLRAQLPNGNYKDCIVNVRATAKLEFESKSITVVPKHSETIKYTIVPESANGSIRWFDEMESEEISPVNKVFSYSINEAEHEITFVGKEPGKGTLRGYFSSQAGGGSSVELPVKCKYDYRLDIESPARNGGLVLTTPAEGEFKIPFRCSPVQMKVEASAPSGCGMEVTGVSYNEVTGKGTVTVRPAKEFPMQEVTITATDMKDESQKVSRSQAVVCKYDSVHVTPVFDFGEGNWSRYEANPGDAMDTLEVGDGEMFTFYLDVAEPGAVVNDVKFTVRQTKEGDARVPSAYIFSKCVGGVDTQGKDSSGRTIYKFGHGKDWVEYNKSEMVKCQEEFYTIDAGRACAWYEDDMGGGFAMFYGGLWWNGSYSYYNAVCVTRLTQWSDLSDFISWARRDIANSFPSVNTHAYYVPKELYDKYNTAIFGYGCTGHAWSGNDWFEDPDSFMQFPSMATPVDKTYAAGTFPSPD